jgi:hypothetical protein
MGAERAECDSKKGAPGAEHEKQTSHHLTTLAPYRSSGIAW